MATTTEKIEFNHPNFNNRFISVEVEKVDNKVVSMKCNVPELGDLNRGDMQRTYENLVAFAASVK